jgi:hypothetical protein
LAKAPEPLPEPAEPRTWTDDSGKFTVTARFDGVINANVRLLKEDASQVTVPLARLSTEDQQWIEERLKQPPRGAVAVD